MLNYRFSKLRLNDRTLETVRMARAVDARSEHFSRNICVHRVGRTYVDILNRIESFRVYVSVCDCRDEAIANLLAAGVSVSVHVRTIANMERTLTENYNTFTAENIQLKFSHGMPAASIHAGTALRL